MNIEFTKNFDKEYASLSGPLREKSRKAVDLFLRACESRQFPKGLRLHKCGPFISISVTLSHRIFALPVHGGMRFVFIGDHEATDRYLRK
ncbi:MAG: hypothetical protein ABH891_07955 [Candidatus Omnitrophota bacterium]